MIWKKINEAPNYFINNTGEVFGPKGRVLKLGKSSKEGYYILKPYKSSNEKWYVHRLVLEYFGTGIPAGMICNHIDGNKLNNHVSNLEAVTYSQNLKHAYDTGLRDGYS